MAFRFTMPVRFADVDHAGIVYYPLFFHYFHQAFEEIFRVRMGAAGYLALLDDQRIGLPAVHAEADFRHPLKFGDEVTVEVSLDRMGARSLTLRYRALGPKDQICAEGRVTCALINLDTFRPIEAPPELRRLFESL
jgi:4-hydroxybenzoyl-CoA thioesterase